MNYAEHLSEMKWDCYSDKWNACSENHNQCNSCRRNLIFHCTLQRQRFQRFMSHHHITFTSISFHVFYFLILQHFIRLSLLLLLPTVNRSSLSEDRNFIKLIRSHDAEFFFFKVPKNFFCFYVQLQHLPWKATRVLSFLLQRFHCLDKERFFSASLRFQCS